MLRNLRVKKLRRSGKPELVDVQQELARQAEALVDVVALVQIRVVDESLPADDGSWFLKVGAHHDHEMVRVPIGDLLQSVGVFERCGGVMYRARADDHGNPWVLAIDDLRHGQPGVSDDVRCAFADADFFEQNRWGDKGTYGPNSKVVGTSKHGLVAKASDACPMGAAASSPDFLFLRVYLGFPF